VHARAWMVRSAGLLSLSSSACTLLYRRSSSPGRNLCVSFAAVAQLQPAARRSATSRRWAAAAARDEE
jgi:hypothetical protein